MHPARDTMLNSRHGEIYRTPEPGRGHCQPSVPASAPADSLCLHLAIAAGLLWLVLNGA